MLTPSVPAYPAGELGPWVRQWRHSQRWTQERLAEALGYEVSYIAKIERGRRRPTGQFLARLASVVDVDQQDLMQMSRRPTARVRLPISNTQIVGRGREIAEVRELLRTSRCVTLVGAPGIGKTSVALETAWIVAGDFRNGACFVPLAEVTSARSVPSTVVQSLGLSERGTAHLENLLCQVLRDRQLLLVLDNFEHVLAARTLVQLLLDGTSNVRMLITSREPLGVPGESPYLVRALGFPKIDEPVPADLEDYPAVRLFVERSRMVRHDFALNDTNARFVMEICSRLAGLPLAITLTARASRILSPSDIARSLRARLELATDDGGEPLAHRRLETALEWSWAMLPAGHQALLASLGVFSGGCSLAALEAVCAEDGEDILPGLAALESKSLIEAVDIGDGASRLVCLEPIRRYALQKLESRRLLDAVRARHCSHFLALAEAAESKMLAGDEQSAAFKDLEMENANLAAAFDWALKHSPESALRLGAALWRFYSIRRISEGRRWLTLALAGISGPPLLRSRALGGLAILARAQGDLAVAETSLARASTLAAGSDGRRELAFARLTEGIVAEDQARYDIAEARFIEATDLYRSVGDERGVGHGLNCLGVVALRRGDIPSASAQFHAALGRFRLLNDRWSIAVTATNLGWIAGMAGDLAEARDWYEESRLIWDDAGDEHGRGRSMVNLGRLARRQRQFGQARSLLEEALRTVHRVGDRRLAAACLGELADVAYERKRLDLSARLLGAADGLRNNIGTPAWPEESALEAHLLRELGAAMGAAAADRTYTMGRALTLEDAVAMVHSDTWPPSAARRLRDENGD
jgi:predicted ATPase/DNA-binding XRE family transcriptional regulator